jgi:thiol-disulfide isomerase/thioredoxin
MARNCVNKLQSVVWVSVFGIAAVALAASAARAASPSAEQALKLTPVQKGVDYDRPTPEESAKCKISAKKVDGHVAWIVESPTGVVLRRFLDSNDDNVVDQWSYFKDGIEVYRDVDSNFNGKVDQSRWLNTAGSRWAIDANEDGVVDSWKAISAEEATAEAIAAMATQDADRFARLVLSANELKSFGLGKSRSDDLAAKTAKSVAEFGAMAARQKTVTRDAVWVQFSATRPGAVPAGTDGSTQDMRVYENAVAIVEAGGKHTQVQMGTLVQVGDAWRLIDLPQPNGEGTASSGPTGFFFQTAMHRNDAATPGATDNSQGLLADLEALDRDLAKATTPEEQAKITGRRADLLEKIATSAKTAEDRSMWYRQLADMIGAAVQSGTFPNGAERLKTLFEKLQKSESDKALISYVRFRQLTADYVLSMQAKKADYSKIQTEWLKTLQQYISDYPNSSDAAEAMLQLAISQEFTGQDEEALKWYARIVKEFPDSAAAKKAAGAQTRLDSVGKSITLSGKSPAGGTIDLAKYRGKVVLIQYWATWSSPAKADMATLKELFNKYGRSFTVVGVNLDNDVKDLNAYLADNPLPWPQIFEEGGLDGRPANVLGILTVPTMILVDAEGKVVNRNVAIADIESELKKLVK